MKQQEFKSLIEKAEDYDVRKCDWCNVWKPQRDMLEDKVFGITTCHNCWYNFYKLSTSEKHAEDILNWLAKRLKKFGIIVKIEISHEKPEHQPAFDAG